VKAKVIQDVALLNKFVKAVNKNYNVKIGILGQKDHRKADGNSNATIGLKHEFGSFSDRIPKRSWLRMPLMEKAGTILKKISKNTLVNLGKGNYRQVFEDLAVECRFQIQEAFETQGFGHWPDNKPATIRAKTTKTAKKKAKREHKKVTSMVLVDTAQMRLSVTHKVKEIK